MTKRFHFCLYIQPKCIWHKCKKTGIIKFIAVGFVITLNKTVQGLYTENYEKLPREIKEDQNKYKDILCL